MFVSAPIPQLCITLSLQFKEAKDTHIVIDIAESMSTTTCEVGIKNFDDKLVNFIKRFDRELNLIYFTAAFVSYYFTILEHEEMADLFTKLMNQYNKYSTQKLHDYDAGYLTGTIVTCLMADQNMNNNVIDIPKDIQEAINYIESEQFIVHLQKHDEKRT